MKMRRATAFILILSAVLLLVGCGDNGGSSIGKKQKNTFGNANNGFYLYRNLSVQDCHIYSFDKDYYDADEFRKYLQEDIDAYNDMYIFEEPETMVPATNEEGATLETVGPQAENSVTIMQCEKKKEELYLSLLYSTPEDVILYNGEEITKLGGTALQAGKLTSADRSILDETYTDPDGNSFDINAAVTSEEASEYRYFLCNFEAYLYGDGEIVAYTSKGTYDKDANNVKVAAGNTVIVIFKNIQY